METLGKAFNPAKPGEMNELRDVAYFNWRPLGKSELDPETLAHIDLAKSSRTYDEYVFKREISQMPPKSESEYGVNRLGRILTLDARSGYLLLQEVKD